MKREELFYLQEDSLELYEEISSATVSTKEDVATLIEVYSKTLEHYESSSIKYAMQDGLGNYFMVVNPLNTDVAFDLVSFIEEQISLPYRLSSLNIKTEFPEYLSRGVFILETEDEPEEEVEANEVEEVEEDEEDEVPTSYLDVDDSYQPYSLKRLSTQEVIDVPEGCDFKLGRSSKADYSILGNTSISREHCILNVDDNGILRVRNISKTNGTKVNGIIVEPGIDRILQRGDSLMLSNEYFNVI